MSNHLKNLWLIRKQWKIKVRSVHLIEIAFDDIAERDYAAEKIEELLYSMGQTGTMLVRSE
jgi:hypothetical protein